jgi:uncharacterized protein YcbK (DUF882 family)
MSHYLRDFDAYLKGHGITRFTAAELCPVGRVAGGVTLQAPPCELWDRIIPTLRIMQEAREHYGRPMTVTSGYRSLAYNRAIGSTDGSLHVQFRACDVSMQGITPRQLRDWFDLHAESGKLGLGLYNTFVHIDTRGTRARW